MLRSRRFIICDTNTKGGTQRSVDNKDLQAGGFTLLSTAVQVPIALAPRAYQLSLVLHCNRNIILDRLQMSLWNVDCTLWKDADLTHKRYCK